MGENEYKNGLVVFLMLFTVGSISQAIKAYQIWIFPEEYRKKILNNVRRRPKWIPFKEAKMEEVNTGLWLWRHRIGSLVATILGVLFVWKILIDLFIS